MSTVSDEDVAIAMGSASRYADVVVKTWMAAVLKKPIDVLFPGDPPIDHVADIKFEPHDGSRGFTLRLAVVDSNYTLVADEPDVKRHVAMLLQSAHLFIRMMISKHLPEHAWIKPVPSPWGTIYLPGVPPDVPQIGVVRSPGKN